MEPFKIQRQPRSRINGLMSKKDQMSTEHISEISDMTRAINSLNCTSRVYIMCGIKNLFKTSMSL